MSELAPPHDVVTKRDGFWLRIIYIVSALVCAAVAFLILGPRPEGTHGALDVSTLPTLNASLNALTTLLLLTGWWLIKQKKVQQHKRVMLAAFTSSSAFLVSYVIYHWFKVAPRAYQGDFRGLYLVILLTHIVLAASIVPLALVTLYRGWSMAVVKHRRIAKITLPLWLYVSVTGVLIYSMLYL
jgi:putative membrane protein